MAADRLTMSSTTRSMIKAEAANAARFRKEQRSKATKPITMMELERLGMIARLNKERYDAIRKRCDDLVHAEGLVPNDHYLAYLGYIDYVIDQLEGKVKDVSAYRYSKSV